MNGTSHANGVPSPEPESPKSHWSDLTGATSEPDAADNEDGSPPAAPVQPFYGTCSVGHVRDSEGMPFERDGPVEPWGTRSRTSGRQNGAQTGNTAGLGEDLGTDRGRVGNDVRLDQAIQGLAPTSRLFDEDNSPMIPLPKAETPTNESPGEQAHESEASKKDSMPAIQPTATATSTRETSNEQDDEMGKAGTMPSIIIGTSASDTSMETEIETANTVLSSGQPILRTVIDGSMHVPQTERQVRQGLFSASPTNPSIRDVSQQQDKDVENSNPAGTSSAEQHQIEEVLGTPQTKPTNIGPPEPVTPPSMMIGLEQSSVVRTSTVQSPPSSQKRRRASNSSDGETPASGGSRKRGPTRKAAWDTRSSPSIRRS